MQRSLRLLLLGAGAVAVVCLAAACGSSSKSTTTTTSATTTTAGSSAETATWANSACSAFVIWRSAIVAAGKSVTANPTKAGVNQALANAKAATVTLQSTLKALHIPTTDTTSQARQELQQLKGQLQNDVAVIKRTIASVSVGSGGASQAASTVKTGMLTMRQQIQATAKELRALPSGDVAQAFKAAPACKTLASSSS